jgi:hypothetical protein
VALFHLLLHVEWRDAFPVVEVDRLVFLSLDVIFVHDVILGLRVVVVVVVVVVFFFVAVERVLNR